MTKQQKAQAQLDSHFLTNPTITTLDLKNLLIKNWPEEMWTQQWVSGFMQSLDLEYTNDVTRSFRIYEKPATLTLQDLEGFVSDIEALGENITKTNLKHLVRGAGLPLGNFQELFDELGLQHLKNSYTSDNHKIWTRVPKGKHLSQSKGQLVDISTMAKPYLKNTILRREADYGLDLHSALTDESTEMHKLLKAYFTYNLRQEVNKI